MNILITGGTGFIGKVLCQSLLQKQHQLTVLSRHPEKVPELCGIPVHAISDINSIPENEHFDAIINLAGEGIADARWTAKRKQLLRDSRIKTTQQLVDYMKKTKHKPAIFISGSAIGFYGDQGSKTLTESSDVMNDYAHQLCAEWETVALKAENLGIRVCILRTGLVLGDDGGFLVKMLPAFKLGLGGQLGNGQQWMSWIHRSDLISIIEKMLKDESMQGTYNGTAPAPVTNKAFSKTLAKKLNRPAIFPVPAVILKLLLGEMAELLLGSQRVIPDRLEKTDFRFKFVTLEEALDDVL